jgi:Tol biopolymer transport system component
MGEVYRAHDTRVHRDVAVKTSAEKFTERFGREAQAIAALNHPNVCTLYDVGPNYLVMELVEGPTLADRIASGAMPLDESLKLAGQIADALSAAHRRGVIHRDLKPGNIKVRADGMVKVLDFGLAKVNVPAAVSDNSPTLTGHDTMAGVVLGTAAYMSPEQAKGKPVDTNTDVWAFGVVLYEMLTGKQLHQGESVSETLASVLKEEPDLTRVPRRVRRLLRSCLQKNPDERLHDVADWRLLLDDDVPDALAQGASSAARWLWPAVTGLLLAALVTVAALQLRKAPQLGPEVQMQVPQPDGLRFTPGTQAAISPDARWLAFPAGGPDNISRMYLRSIDSLEVRPLLGSEGIISNSPPPFWSYDSRFVVYGAQGKLKKSEITGTPAQAIADTGIPFVQGGTWSREGVIVYGRNGGNLQQVSSTGGTPTAVTRLSVGEIAHRYPQFLPDGRRFLYLRVSSTPDKTGVYVGSLAVKPEEQDLRPLVLTNRQAWWFTSELTGTSYLLIQRDEALLAQPFDVNTATLSGTSVPVVNGVGSFAGATSGLWSVARAGALVYRSGGTGLPQPTWVDSTGRVLGTAGDPGNYNGPPVVSPDGNRLAFSLGDAQGNLDIWVRDLVGGGNTRLTFDPRRETFPVWSPDGKRIVYAAERGGRQDLYEKNADGSGEERLVLQSDQDKTPTSWSPDGHFLLFTSVDPKTREDLWILPLEGDRKPFAFLQTDAQENVGRFSPDQRWITYAALTATGVDAFVRPFTRDSRSPAGAGGPLWMVSTNGGTSPRWSGDGKKLFYVGLNGDLMAVDTQAGVSFQAGTPQRLFNTLLLFNNNWSMSPSGDRFLLIRPSASSGPPPPFTIVLNWIGKLTP